LLWVLMITSAENRPWAGDIELAPLHGTGLSAPSVVRTAKIATIDRGRAEARGTIAPAVLDAVRAAVRARLGL
jgi:mRNA interferase MazF